MSLRDQHTREAMRSTRDPRPATIRNLAHIERDTGYRWRDNEDPIMEFLRNDITDSGWPAALVAQRAGLATSTVRNIMTGRTRHPLNVTVESIFRALGWHRPIVRYVPHRERE